MSTFESRRDGPKPYRKKEPIVDEFPPSMFRRVLKYGWTPDISGL